MEKISVTEANALRITPIPFFSGDVVYLSDASIWKSDWVGTFEDWSGTMPLDPAGAKNSRYFCEAYQFWVRAREVFGEDRTPAWADFCENLLEQIWQRPYEVVDDSWLLD